MNLFTSGLHQSTYEIADACTSVKPAMAAKREIFIDPNVSQLMFHFNYITIGLFPFEYVIMG